MGTEDRENFDRTLEGTPQLADPDDVPQSVIEDELALFKSAAPPGM